MSTMTIRVLLATVLAVATQGCVLVAPAKSGTNAGHDVVVCHKGKKTMTLPQSAAGAHLDHGDRYGAC